MTLARPAETVRIGQEQRPDRAHHLGPVEERQALLRPELERLEARLAQREQGRDPLAAELHLAPADERQREVGERREVARGAHAALLRHDRVDARGRGTRAAGRRSSGRQPLWPSASVFARRRSIARTTSRGKAGPTPAAWLIRRFSWSRPVRAGSIDVVARSPKPVVTPYTTAPAATRPSMTSRASCIRARACTSSAAVAPCRATASTSAIVRSAPVRTIGPASVPARRAGSGTKCGSLDWVTRRA